MGRFLPGLRRGSREQVTEFDRTQRDLNEYGKRARKTKVRAETPEFTRLNSEVNRAAQPLSRLQQSRPVRDERMAAADRRARREQRRARRGRGSR